jgi:hypothetical protein
MLDTNYISKRQINYIEIVFNFLNNTKGCIDTHEVVYLLNYLLGHNIYNVNSYLKDFVTLLSGYVEKDDFDTFLGALLNKVLDKYNDIKESE